VVVREDAATARHRRPPPGGGTQRVHHIAYHLDHLQDLWDAADILSEYNVEIDGGPRKCAIMDANYLYVKDPASGIRIELFAGPGYLNFEPD